MLLYKLTYLDPNKPREKPKFIIDFGKYNTLPTPWKRCSVNDFIHHMSIYTPELIESKQITDKDLGFSYRSCHIYWWNTCAIAVVYPSKWRCANPEFGEGRGIIYEQPIHYFMIGCNHDWAEIGKDECQKRGWEHYGVHWHVQECQTCGLVNSYDSSG